MHFAYVKLIYSETFIYFKYDPLRLIAVPVWNYELDIFRTVFSAYRGIQICSCPCVVSVQLMEVTFCCWESEFILLWPYSRWKV